MSIFGFRVVNLYKRVTPKDKVPFAQYQHMNVNAEYQVHFDQQSVYGAENDIYQKFQLIFRVLMLTHKLMIKGKFGYNGSPDKFRHFESADYVIKDLDSLKTVSEVVICGVDTISDFDVLNNDICELVEQWMKLDNNDIPYEKQVDHLIGTYEQVLQFVKQKTKFSSTMGTKTVDFMKQYNITKGNLLLMATEQSMEQIMKMKKQFQQKKDFTELRVIPEVHIKMENYFVDIVQNSPELVMSKLMIKTVGEEQSYSLEQYQQQWQQFEKKDKDIFHESYDQI